eukprot:scaffold25623_cov101-Isochrysis_galbana.AAC.6
MVTTANAGLSAPSRPSAIAALIPCLLPSDSELLLEHTRLRTHPAQMTSRNASGKQAVSSM